MAPKHGGHAVEARRAESRVPEHLCVVVGMHVHKPRRDHATGGVQSLLRGFGHLAYFSDASVRDADIAGHGRCARPVHQATILDD